MLTYAIQFFSCHSFHIRILVSIVSLFQFFLWEQVFLHWFLSVAQAASQRILYLNPWNADAEVMRTV